MELTFYIFVSIVLIWILNLWNFKESVKLAYKIPSNKWNTLIGFGKITGANNVMQILQNHRKKYGSNSILWTGPIPVFLTTDPKTIKSIFMSKNCINKPSIFMKGMTLTMGLGLTSANEPIWSQHRKILNKSFSPNNLKSFFPLFNKEVDLMVKSLDRIIEKGENIELLEFFEQLTLKISAATILRKDLDPKKFDLKEIAIYFIRIGEYVADACMKFYYKINVILKLSGITKFRESVKGVTFCRELIKESSRNLQNNINGDYPEIKSTLDYALNGVRENGLKEEEVYGSLMHIFFGAVDATSSALYYIIIMLALHPEYQERLYEELMSVIPDKNDNDLSLDQMNKCSYLDMVINESLRLAPVVPTVTRQVSNGSFSLDNGITLPQNQYVVIDIFGLHRSEEIWGPDADQFNPDNFLPSNVESRHPFAYIPFTKGLRFCIGWKYGLLTVKISLVKILMRYKFSTDFKYENLIFQNHVILKLAEKPQIHMQRRGNL